MIIIFYHNVRGSHQATSNNPNYDAGIVLIDLHQLNVKQLQTIQISDTEYGATSSTKNKPANNNDIHTY